VPREREGKDGSSPGVKRGGQIQRKKKVGGGYLDAFPNGATVILAKRRAKGSYTYNQP